MSNSNTQSGGIGFVGLLTIAFIILKLTGFIAWSWWWILAPIWITLGIWIAVILIIAIIALIVANFG